ncbi:MAG: glycosyltransferase family 9 protein [Caldilineae bacterium]|nr:glycosyltransferase family 9 protein [Chloroflexota bacterium]MCB9177530.1 glycosyltransferase family 9 protein [Caldilineae bacterium]
MRHRPDLNAPVLPGADGSPRILVIKLSDFGDALLTTPALAQLRAALPAARIDVLTTRIGAVAYRHSSLVDDLLCFDKSVYDRPLALLSQPADLFGLAARLRRRGYDALALMHTLTTRFGALKHAGLCLASGAPIRAGLRRPSSPRGAFLTHWGTDFGFDRQHAVEVGESVAAALLAALGQAPAEAPPRHLRFEPGPAAESAAEALLKPLMVADAPLVAIHPGSGSFSTARRWSPAGFASVADRLAAQGARILVVGGPDDGCDAVVGAMRRPPALDLSGRSDLPTLAAILARCRLLVGNDSGVSHLASAMGCPVVAVFGPSNPVAWGPWWPGVDARGRPAASPHRVVRLGLPCQPCFYVGYRRGSPAGCPSRDCLAWMPADRVIAAAESLL